MCQIPLFLILVTQEAVSTGDPELLKIVLTHRDSHMLQNQAKIITALLEKLKATPDFYVEIKWEFTSWCESNCPSHIFNPFLSHFYLFDEALERLSQSFLLTIRCQKLWDLGSKEQTKLVFVQLSGLNKLDSFPRLFHRLLLLISNEKFVTVMFDRLGHYIC